MSSLAFSNRQADTYEQLYSAGWALLPKECDNSQQFDELLGQFVSDVTFDPARSASSRKTQLVDSGVDAIGLHIENGNTPLPPDIVAFHCVRAAKQGSQTTVCDGIELWKRLPVHIRALFMEPITVRRNLQSSIWKRYVATALGRTEHARVTAQDLHCFLRKVPGQHGLLRRDASLDYILRVNAVRDDNICGCKAFANALMGPSFNYESPEYSTADGKLIEPSLIDELREIAEPLIHDICWTDGDVLLIDNKRVMHGRRSIEGLASERIINIGMGKRV